MSAIREFAHPSRSVRLGPALIVAAAAVFVGTACSSSSSGAQGGTLPFDAKDQIFYGQSGSYELKILDYTAACSIEQASDSHVAGSMYIEIDYAGATAPAPGTYSVPSEMVVELHQRDASCSNTVEVSATSGSVTITSESSTLLQGTFSAALSGYGTVSGSLSAAFCDTSTTTGPYACVAGPG